MIVLAAALLCLTALAMWRDRGPARAPDQMRAVPLTAYPGIETDPSLSPDGTQVAFMWTGPDQNNADIWVHTIGSPAPPKPLTSGPESDYNPAWSPDGLSIVFLRAPHLPPPSSPLGATELWLIPAAGGRPPYRLSPLSIANVGSPAFVAWTPDSKHLIVTDSPGTGQPDALFVLSIESGDKRQLTSPTLPSWGDTNPAVSPDGRSVIFRRASTTTVARLYLQQLSADLRPVGEPRPLTPAGGDAAYPSWLPDGKEIVFSRTKDSAGLWRLNILSGGEPARVPFVGDDAFMPVVSRPRHGEPVRLVYRRTYIDHNVWRVDPSAPGRRAVAWKAVFNSSRTDVNGDISPDGSRVTFASNRNGALEIWQSEIAGRDILRITSMKAIATATPRWSPDGAIAFQSNFAGNYDVYVLEPGEAKPRQVTSHQSSDHVPTFSRDGKWVYFASTRTGSEEIWKVPRTGGDADAEQVTTTGGFLAVEDWQGRYLYYSKRSGRASVWRVPVTGGTETKVLDEIPNQAFAIVETGIYYVEGESKNNRLRYYDFATSRHSTVTDDIGEIAPLLSASRDGRHDLFSRIDVDIRDLMLVDNFR